jgi:hypothetical protein
VTTASKTRRMWMRTNELYVVSITAPNITIDAATPGAMNWT